MTQEIEKYIEAYPEETVRLFMKIREVIYSIESISVEERMWAKLPSYYCGDRFVRLIPFKDHINIEAEGLTRHISEFEGLRFTPKGMLQIQTNQDVSLEALKSVFAETYM